MKQTKDKLSLSTTTLRTLVRPLTEQALAGVAGGVSNGGRVCYQASAGCYTQSTTNPTNGCQ